MNIFISLLKAVGQVFPVLFFVLAGISSASLLHDYNINAFQRSLCNFSLASTLQSSSLSIQDFVHIVRYENTFQTFSNISSFLMLSFSIVFSFVK